MTKTSRTTPDIPIMIEGNVASVAGADRPVREAIEKTVQLISPAEPDEELDWRDLCASSRGKLSFPRMLLHPVRDELRIAGYEATIDGGSGQTHAPASRHDIWLNSDASFVNRHKNVLRFVEDADRGLALVASEDAEVETAIMFASSILEEDRSVLVLAPRSRSRVIRQELQTRTDAIELLRNGEPVPTPRPQLVIAPPSFAAEGGIGQFSAVVAIGMEPLLFPGAFQNLMYGPAADVPLYGVATANIGTQDSLRLRMLFRDEIDAARPRRRRLSSSQVIALRYGAPPKGRPGRVRHATRNCGSSWTTC